MFLSERQAKSTASNRISFAIGKDDSASIKAFCSENSISPYTLFLSALAVYIYRINVLEAIQSERTIRFAWLAPLVWDNVFHAIASGQVDLSPIITNKFSLDRCEEGIKYMKESKDDKIKGLVLID